MAYTLHDFQIGAVNAALGAIGKRKNELIVLPTGSGKSLVLAGIIEKLKPSATRRILVISHVREIIMQDAATIAQQLPNLSLGVMCAGLGRWEWGKSVVVGSVQSMHRRRHFGTGFDVILVDEAHLIGRRDAAMYQKLFKRLQDGKKKRIPIIGLTATPYRLDSGYLHKGEGALFTGIAYDIPATKLVDAGILAPLTTEPLQGIDFSQLPRRNKEYVIADYTANKDGAWLAETSACVDQIKRLAADRKSWLIFACTIKHAEAITALLTQSGIRSATVHNKTKKRERDNTTLAFKAGTIQALVNVNVLTTGFDAPGVDCIAMVRPTLSTGLYCQILGRGMRKSTGKRDCLVLDFAGNIERHGPLTDIMPERRDHIAREPSATSTFKRKIGCPACSTSLPVLVKQCYNCGHLFPEITPAPSKQSIMAPAEAAKIKKRAATAVPPGPSDYPYLSSEEVAAMIGTTPQYVKQMRHFGTGPKFYGAGAMTGVGWRHIVYRAEDVEKWQATLTVYPGHKPGAEGRAWRVRPKTTEPAGENT